MKKLFFSTKFQLTVRIILASVSLLMGNIATFCLALFVPIYRPVKNSYGFTPEEDTQIKELLGEVSKESKRAIEKFKETLATEIKDSLKGVVTESELAQKMEAMGLKDDAIGKLTKAIEVQGEEMRKVFDKKQAQKSVDEIIHDKASDISKIASGETRLLKFEIPATAKTTVERSAYGSSTLGTRIPEIGTLDYNQMNLYPLFRKAQIGPNSNGVVRYMDQNAITRAAAAKAESASFPESVISWVERTLSVEKIADSIPVSKEAFRDLEFVKSELDRLLNVNLTLKEDQALYSGTGVAPEITGINVYAVTAQATLGAAPYVDTVDYCNVYDLIAVLKVVIMAGKKNYVPSVVLLNPADVLRYRLLKGTDGHYVLPPFITASGQIVDGVRVVESNQVTANTLTIGDTRYATIWEAQGIEVEMGWVNDQFIKDQMTIKASKRLGLLVRTVDLGAWKKLTDVTAALALLETP